METFFKLVGLVLFSILVIAIISVGLIWIFALICFALCMGVVAWAFGAHIKIKQNDILVGYIKWFTYYPYTK